MTKPSSVFSMIAIASAAALLPAGCGRSGKVEANAPVEAPTVAVAKASTQDMSRTLVLTAEFKPFQEIDVMAKVAGYVKVIRVDVGDRVKQGDLLATLEVPEMTDEITRAKAAVDRSTAEVRRARDDLQRAESAHDMTHLTYARLEGVMENRPGLVAQQEVDDAHAKDLVSEAQIAAARSNLEAAGQQVNVSQAELEKYRTMFNYTKVVAPFAGVITKRFADTGSMIQAGTASQTQAMPLVRLSENSLLRLILPVPESVVSTIRAGSRVEVRVPSLKRNFPGQVARFSGRIQLSTRTMETEVDVPNPDLVLVPGMYAEVNLTLERRDHVVAVPLAAVDPGSDAAGRVMVITADNRVEPRRVSIGLENAQFAEITSGLRDGELVVIGARSALEPGQTVRPKLTDLAEIRQGS